jgi:DNA-binding CsgD family transcriptional regulator
VSERGIDACVRDIAISGAILDPEGVITEVSAGWRHFADHAGLQLERYGLGANYLKYCIFPDESSVEILRGLKRVLAKETDLFSTLYPCGHPSQLRWFLLAAFASAPNEPGSLVVHIDISNVLRNKVSPSAAMVGVGPSAVGVVEDMIVRTIRRSIADSMSNARPAANPVSAEANGNERKKLDKLTSNQLQLLCHLASGASNAEIASARGVSLNTVKAQVAGLTRKLEFSNRTQVALFAVRNGIVPR